MQERVFTNFVVCPSNERMPRITGRCESEQEAREYAQESASEYGQTMRLFMGPEGAVLPWSMETATHMWEVIDKRRGPRPSPMSLVCYVEPAKASGNEPWAIFVSNHVTIEPEFTIHSPELDPQELRFWLLYWDEIGICDNNVEPRKLSSTEQSLRDAGILNRYAMNWACEVEGRELVEDSFLFTFQRINKSEPGKWSAGIEGRSICYPPRKKRLVHKDTGEEFAHVLLTLNRALPVPAAEVTLDDVLDFRRRRMDEVLAFRLSMESIYRLGMAIDVADQFNPATESLRRALANLERVATESSIKFLNGGFEARLKKSVPNLNWVDQESGLSVLNTPLRAAEAKIYFRIDAGLKRPLLSDRPYSYIPKVHPEETRT